MSEHAGPEDAGPVTLINIFEIPAEQVDEFIQGWTERARIMSTHAGFRDATLHRALSPAGRFQLVNVGHWDSVEAYTAAQADPEFLAARTRATQDAPQVAAHPELYRVVAGYASPSGLPADA